MIGSDDTRSRCRDRRAARYSPRDVPTRYCLIEADHLITSHDPMTFEVDPRYPAATQERRQQ